MGIPTIFGHNFECNQHNLIYTIKLHVLCNLQINIGMSKDVCPKKWGPLKLRPPENPYPVKSCLSSKVIKPAQSQSQFRHKPVTSGRPGQKFHPGLDRAGMTLIPDGTGTKCKSRPGPGSGPSQPGPGPECSIYLTTFCECTYYTYAFELLNVCFQNSD